MANDLYREKDKMELARTNPRNSYGGGLSSGNISYNNYLAGMKPRSKTPENERTERNRTSSNNFRKSVGVTDLQEDADKVKASRALYAEMSSVPVKKTTCDLSYDKASKPKATLEKRKSLDQEEKVKNDTTLSVGKLRSMFDNPTSDNTTGPILRNNDSTTNKRKNHFKRYSALEPLQSPPRNDMGVTSKVKLNVDAMINNNNEETLYQSTPRDTLNIDAMVGGNDNNSNENNIVINSNTVKENNLSNKLDTSEEASTCKTKGMHGLLSRKGSEFDDFEDRIVPTGTKTIDISSLLAPAPADGNNNHKENSTENQNGPSVSASFDLQKKRELDRLINAQEGVNIHRALNIKRRSLKDKLNDMCYLSQDSFDHGVVPYESISQPIQQASNINSNADHSSSHVPIEDNFKITSSIDTKDKQCEITNETEVSCGIQECNVTSEVVPRKVNDTVESDNNNEISDLTTTTTCSENNFNANVTGEVNIGELKIEIDQDEVLEITIESNVNMTNKETVKPDQNNVKPELPEVESSILITAQPTEDRVSDDSLSPDKPYESIVERFDAFLTSHGIADPDILSPVPISDAEINAKTFSGIFDGKLDADELSSIDGRLPIVESVSLIEDESSNDISDDLSIVYDKLPTDVSDLSLDDTLLNEISDVSVLDDNFPSIIDDNSLSIADDNSPSIPDDDTLSVADEDPLPIVDDNSLHVCIDDFLPSVHTEDNLSKVQCHPLESLRLPNLPGTNIAENEDTTNIMDDKQLHGINIESILENEQTISVNDVGLLTAVKVEADVELPSLTTEKQEEVGSIIVEPDSEIKTSDDIVLMENHAPVMPQEESVIMGKLSVVETLSKMEELSTDEATPKVCVDASGEKSISVNEVLQVKNEFPQSLSTKNHTDITEPVSEPMKPKDSSSSSSDDDYETLNANEQEVKETTTATQTPLCRTETPVALQAERQGIKNKVQMPKKSNLSKSKGSSRKKVNFADAFLNDVILTYGPTEYDRANADIDPIASSAEWELEKRVDKMDVFSVDLQKDERGLGLSIIGLGVGTETGVEKLGIFVKTLTENGASQKDGRIQVNDQILEVNGISLVGVTQYFAAQTLKNTDGVVRFLMGREKSRRSQYSPGAPLAGNPEMHKHIEEMNKVLQQLEEFEDRAINAESTLEDVKLELLKAEERAHDAERQLKDTKEQLTAVTESPFIGNGRKLKNEIKKKGGKQLDTLQRSLTDVTNQLNISEEHLNDLQTETGNKDNHISILQQKVLEQEAQLKQMESSTQFLHNEIGCKSDEVKALHSENGQLKEQINELTEKHQKEKEKLAKLQVEMAVKAESDVGDLSMKSKKLENENKNLKDEILALSGRLEINEHLLNEVRQDESQDERIKMLEEKVNDHMVEVESTKEANLSMQEEVETLKETNEYLQTLIIKLETREDMVPENLDLELRFKEKEEEYIEQNEMLRSKISTLETSLSQHLSHDQKPDQSQLSILSTEIQVNAAIETPTLPIRGYVNVNTLNGIHRDAPEVSRAQKPGLLKEAAFEQLEIDVEKVGDDPVLSSNDSGIESINNLDEIDVNSPSIDLEVSLPKEDIHINTDSGELSPTNSTTGALSPTNPIPKPERGKFITIDTEISPGIHNDIEFDFEREQLNNEGVLSSNVEPTELHFSLNEVPGTTINKTDEEESIKTLGVNISSSVTVPDDTVDISEVKQLEVGSTDSITTDVNVLTSSTPNKTLGSSELCFDLDDLPEGKIDNDSDEDQGEFQLIQEEIEEEQQTPSLTNRAIRMHSDLTANRKCVQSEPNLDCSLTADGSFDQWLTKDWSRLNSTAREEEADMIAAQVTADTPAARTFSTTSSTSSEDGAELIPKEAQRAHSIKIDESYLTQTPKVESSFDEEMLDVLTTPVHDTPEVLGDFQITGDITKSLSFDSAIPPTPVLDNHVARDKKAVMNHHRAKPSRSPHISASQSPTTSDDRAHVDTTSVPHSPRVALADKVTFREADGTESSSTLPRPTFKPSSNLHAAQSVPNLTQIHNDKPKRKHKYIFHLPKAFKRTKLGKKLSQDSFSKKERGKGQSLSLSDSDFTSSPDILHSVSEVPYSPSLHTETSVVPMEEKAAALNQEKVNDAATEEAVVPFADKEMLMTGSTSDTNISLQLQASDKSSLSASPPSQQTSAPPSLQTSAMHADSSPSISSKSTTESYKTNGQRDHLGSVSSSPPRPTAEIEFSSFTSSPMEGSTSPEFYNERGVDVDMTNGHSDGDIVSYKNQVVTQWDVQQVGLWLTDMNMGDYVNNFRLYHVDGSALIRADGASLKEYGIHNQIHRAEVKKHIKELRVKYGKTAKGKDQKTTKDKLQFWKGKYKLN